MCPGASKCLTWPRCLPPNPLLLHLRDGSSFWTRSLDCPGSALPSPFHTHLDTFNISIPQHPQPLLWSRPLLFHPDAAPASSLVSDLQTYSLQSILHTQQRDLLKHKLALAPPCLEPSHSAPALLGQNPGTTLGPQGPLWLNPAKLSSPIYLDFLFSLDPSPVASQLPHFFSHPRPFAQALL